MTAFARVGGIKLADGEVSGSWVVDYLCRSGLTLFPLGSLRPSRPLFDHEHNTIDLTRLKSIIVQLDPENGHSLDTLLERHKQGLIERAEGVPAVVYSYLGYMCSDCGLCDAETMDWEKFQWHALTK